MQWINDAGKAVAKFLLSIIWKLFSTVFGAILPLLTDPLADYLQAAGLADYAETAKEYYALCDAFAPLTEAFAMFVIYLSIWVAFTSFKLLIKMIPTVG
jgi:hypothetical protein